MVCPQCRASISDGHAKCPKCGTDFRTPWEELFDYLKKNPWLIALLACSAVLTMWAATRRAPVAEPVAIPAAAPAVEAPSPEPQQDEAPLPFHPVVHAPVAPAPEPPPRVIPVGEAGPQMPPAGAEREDGTWEAGPGAPKRGGR